MGTWVMITAIWYYMQTNIAEIRRVGQQPALCVHGGDKPGHWIVGDVPMRAV